MQRNFRFIKIGQGKIYVVKVNPQKQFMKSIAWTKI